MPPLPPSSSRSQAAPRVIVYHQTHHDPSGKPVSILPLIGSGVTHVYIAAVHLNDPPENITINDDPPDAERNGTLWGEVRQLRDAGVKVLAMLGGAAKGSYERLGRDFEAYYRPLHTLLQERQFDGIDLDIEEPTPIELVRTLLRRLKADFGPDFIITLAPVMPALLPLHAYLTRFCYRLLHPELSDPGPLIRSFLKAHLLPSRGHMSGFNHFELESSEEGRLVSWYNVQMYCGWGDAGDAKWYDAIIQSGFQPLKVVVGAVTNPGNGSGYVETKRLLACLKRLRGKYGEQFGGVMGWEYFNAGESEGGSREKWVGALAVVLGRESRYAKKEELSALDAGGVRALDPAIREAASLTGLLPASADMEPAPPQAAADDPVARAAALLRSIQVPGGAQAPIATPVAITQSPPASQQTASSASTSDAAKIQQLVDMGFDRDEAAAALEAMGGDVEAAASILS